MTEERLNQFEMAIKRGILRELRRDGMLTDTQLRLLLSGLREQCVRTSGNITCTAEKDME